MMLTPVPNALYYQKSHVAPGFNYLDLKNAKVLLTMLLTMDNVSADSVTQPKSHIKP